jgi:hypothetical protein
MSGSLVSTLHRTAHEMPRQSTVKQQQDESSASSTTNVSVKRLDLVIARAPAQESSPLDQGGLGTGSRTLSRDSAVLALVGGGVTVAGRKIGGASPDDSFRL